MAKRMSSPFTVFRFSCWHFSEAVTEREVTLAGLGPHCDISQWHREVSPSLVMKEMNSLTHSCMHSFASLAILAFSGSAVFIIRATGAKLRMLASCRSLSVALGDNEREKTSQGACGEPSGEWPDMETWERPTVSAPCEPSDRQDGGRQSGRVSSPCKLNGSVEVKGQPPQAQTNHGRVEAPEKLRRRRHF